jgi:hypothetical protein
VLHLSFTGENMTIFDLLVFIIPTFLLGFVTCYRYFVLPLLQRNSRLIGKLNQKEWQIMHWQLAYNKANSDFMKLAEIHNVKPRGELNDC